jgi:hypothetical protein
MSYGVPVACCIVSQSPSGTWRVGHRLSSRFLPGLLILLSVLLVGCGEQRAGAVDVALAKSTLVDVMDHWKNGGTIDELRKRQPEIVVQEALWSDGRTLLDYALIGEGRPEDANWFCEVELTLSPQEGQKPQKKTLTYVVGTDPVLTVFRAIL